jgi:hypothetical protein
MINADQIKNLNTLVDKIFDVYTKHFGNSIF